IEHALRGTCSCLLYLTVIWGCAGRDVELPNATMTEPRFRTIARVGAYVGLGGASVSPDGQYLVHTDWTTGDLAVHDLLSGESRRITNNGPISRSVGFAEFFMRFAADGRKLAYIWDRNGYEVHLAGMSASAGSHFVYRNPPGQGEVLVYDWSDDGRYLAAVVPKTTESRQLRVVLIDASDGSLRDLLDLDPTASQQQMRASRMSFSPDSRFLAYDLRAGGSQSRDIFVTSLEREGNSVVVEDTADDRLLDWTPDGTALLFWSDRGTSPGVWQQPMRGGVTTGVARRLADLEKGAFPLGFANDGTYYIAVPEARRHEVFVASFDLHRGVLRGMSAPAADVLGPRSAPEWSPDGNVLAYVNRGTVVMRSLHSGEERRLADAGLTEIFTVGTGEKYLRWSPDGLYLLVPQNRTLSTVDISTGRATPAVTDRRSRYGRWSPDGLSLFYTRQSGKNDGIAEIIRMDRTTSEREVLHHGTLPGDHYASLEISPDGRWLAFTAVDAAPPPEFEITTLSVIAASGGPARQLLAISGREWMKVVGWTPKTQEILFTRGQKLGSETSTTLWRMSMNGGEPRRIEIGVPVLHSFRFHPDGRRVAFDSGRRGAEIWALRTPFGRDRR
ncbi:MAG TPA: hypothetical protein VFL80_10760, partial [Thermoanaerobaculia bacterium]|nr:hypothetical protein [Thermoanaerobaculia bacterium]